MGMGIYVMGIAWTKWCHSLGHRDELIKKKNGLQDNEVIKYINSDLEILDRCDRIVAAIDRRYSTQPRFMKGLAKPDC